MKGYIWYYDKIYGGTKEDYIEFCNKHEDVELVMTLQETTMEKVKTVADSLNKSNFVENLRNRKS